MIGFFHEVFTFYLFRENLNIFATNFFTFSHNKEVKIFNTHTIVPSMLIKKVLISLYSSHDTIPVKKPSRNS
jgi:hypothetical protein